MWVVGRRSVECAFAGSRWLLIVIFSVAHALSPVFSLSAMDLRSAPAMRLITNKMCPYAQKAWIALEAAQCEYELVEISLYGSNGKPAWFRKLNPQGTVPVLVVPGKDGSDPVVLPDSDLILNYLQDHCGLKPQDRSQQAAVQTWRNRIRYMQPIAKRAVLGGGNRDELRQCLRTMDDAVVGPFLTGDGVTIADCHAFPFLWRLDQEYGLEEYRKLHAWIETCSKEEAIRKTIQSAWWWWW